MAARAIPKTTELASSWAVTRPQALTLRSHSFTLVLRREYRATTPEIPTGGACRLEAAGSG